MAERGLAWKVISGLFGKAGQEINDSRRAERFHVMYPELATAHVKGVAPAPVINISENGVALAFSTDSRMPPEIPMDLHIVGEAHPLQAHVVFQKSDVAGFRFGEMRPESLLAIKGFVDNLKRGATLNPSRKDAGEYWFEGYKDTRLVLTSSVDGATLIKLALDFKRTELMCRLLVDQTTVKTEAVGVSSGIATVGAGTIDKPALRQAIQILIGIARPDLRGAVSGFLSLAVRQLHG